MPTYQQNRVSQVVWPWTSPVSDPKSHAPSKTMAVVGFCIASVIAFLFYRHEHKLASLFIMSIASIILLCGLFIPPAYAQIHKFLLIFAHYVGLVLTWTLLVPFFYLVFPIGRLSQLIRGKDPMNRKFPTEQPTYWEDRPPIKDKAYYTRQG